MKFSPSVKRFRLDNSLTRQEIFIRFLMHHKIYRKFLKNINNVDSESVTLTTCLSDAPVRYVIGAFNWSKSIEGFDFWNKVHTLWVKELRKPNWVKFYGKGDEK